MGSVHSMLNPTSRSFGQLEFGGILDQFLSLLVRLYGIVFMAANISDIQGDM